MGAGIINSAASSGRTQSINGAGETEKQMETENNRASSPRNEAEISENTKKSEQNNDKFRRQGKPYKQPAGRGEGFDKQGKKKSKEDASEDEKAPSDNAAPEEKNSEPKEYEVIGVRFKPNGKVYYFDPAGNKLERETHVIVDTARGLEFGTVASSNRMVSAKEVVLPLRKLIRLADEEDEKRHEANLERETEAFNLCLSKIEERRLDMKLVDVEYTFDNTKLLFYFTSEGRVDFRDLVKDLASVFRTRIELRQIGIRDEAKLMGGLGVCGRPFCCASFLPDFVQVSIKMAKEQNLSLNSSKISGACGRLMCCLKYEYDTYTDEIAKTPKVDTVVETPDGEGVVVEVSPLAGACKVSLAKNPATIQLYHRDDLKPKGNAKGKRRGNEQSSSDASEDMKKSEGK